MMITRDTTHETPDWKLPNRQSKPVTLPPRCCGTYASDKVCTVCGQWVALGVGEN